jgi:pimeloyl-ACP methyl ester carboxylesterase
MTMSGRLAVDCARLCAIGSGPLLLLIPGGPANAGVFADLAGFLADRYTVVAYDPRGNSRSVADGPPQDQQMDAHGDDAAHLLAAACGGELADVLGSSGGAQIGLNRAARHPQRGHTVVAHEPPCVELLPDAAQQRAATREVVDLYRREGVGAGMQRLGVNVPNLGPGTDPGVLRRWAATVEGLGFDVLMVSDHVVVTPDVAEQYPAPFYEPFTTLAWLAGITDRLRLGATVLVVPYRHPLLIARMAANLNQLSGGRLVLGVGSGWARQEFDALGVAYRQRGTLTDEHLRAVRTAWENDDDYGNGSIPIWVGGNSDAGMRRAVRLGDAWHPLRRTMAWLGEARDRLAAVAAQQRRPVPALAPRIALR